MNIDKTNRLIVIPQAQLRPNTNDYKPNGRLCPLNSIDVSDFPRSRRPVEDAEYVVVYSEDAFIFLKRRRKINLDLSNSLEELDHLHVLLRRISDMIAIDKMNTGSLDDFNFEDIFDRKSWRGEP
jgi:hypothetical protein